MTKQGLYVYRVKFPAGFKVMPHWHGEERTFVVLSGGRVWPAPAVVYAVTRLRSCERFAARKCCCCRRSPCKTLLVKAYKVTIARTFSLPRTFTCRRFQFRPRAWMHSQITRTAYCALPASLAIRARQASSPGPSLRRGW